MFWNLSEKVLSEKYTKADGNFADRSVAVIGIQFVTFTESGMLFVFQVVAMKFISKIGRTEKELRTLRREIEIMKSMHHDNIVEMIDTFETQNEVRFK